MSKVEEHLDGRQLPPKSRRGHRYVSPAIIVCLGLILTSVFASFILNLFNIRIQLNIVHGKARTTRKITLDKLTCSAPLPTLLASHPPRPDAPGLKEAAASLHEFLSIRTADSDIDSLSIALVTPDGPIFEGGYGILRANESEAEQAGILNWDDSVTKFLPNFTHPTYGWSDFLNGNEYASERAPITLRQLASHLSGLGRDYPPADIGRTWPGPLDLEENVVDELLGRSNGSWERLFEAVAKYPLVAPQMTFPVYSNTGFDVLGQCNLAADSLATGQTITYRELMKRDVFEPLGLESSFYHIPDSRLAAQVVVPSSNSEWADMTYHPVFDPSGGQYSSLADLTTVMQSFLSPKGTGVISPYVVREWLRPLHAWSDGFQEVGAPWEIAKVGREARLYSKGGNLPGYHSQFVLNPQWSYGVIVLVTGNYTDTVTLAQEAISRFQPAFENLLVMQVLYAYGGVWVGDDSVAVVTIDADHALYLQTLIVGDQDILRSLQRNPPGEAKAVALWSTGRPHEFRLAIGRPELNGNPDAGCEPYWISIDPPFSRGAPLDLLYWDGAELVYPSAGVRFHRD